MPSRRGKKGNAAAYSLKEVRRRELELAEQAEHAYRQLVADWQAKRAGPKAGRGRRQRDATEKALCGASCAAGLSPRTCASLRGRPRPRRSVTPADTRPQITPPRGDDLARPDSPLLPQTRCADPRSIRAQCRRHPCRRATPPQTNLTPPQDTGRATRNRTATLDTFIRRVDHAADLGGEREERDHVLPRVQPRLGDHREPLAPLLVERLELGLRRGRRRWRCRSACRSRATCSRSRRGTYLQAVADQMHDARLDGRLGEDRLDRLGEARSARRRSRSGCPGRRGVLRSVRTCIQNFAPSVSWNHMPSTSRSPSSVTPSAR